MKRSAAGATTPTAALKFRLLTEADAETVYHVHRRVFSTLSDKSFMYQRELTFFVDMVERKGRIVGAYIDGTLIGYIAFRLAGNPENRHWNSLRHIPLEREMVAEGAGGAVLPEFRNRGVFRGLLRRRHAEAKASGAKFQTTVVAPRNTDCLVPILADGSLMSAVLEDATGKNYLLMKPLLSTVNKIGSGAAVSPYDVSANISSLAENYVGIPNSRGGDIQIVYYSPHAIYLGDGDAPVYSYPRTVDVEVLSDSG
jgi:Acetyltransferase (GNAT) family